MSQSQEENLIIGNGPMTLRRSLNNIVAALNIAQGKGTFNLRESAFVFASLQKLNEFVNKHDPLPQEESKPIEKTIIDTPPQTVQSTSQPSQNSTQVVENKILPDLNKEQDNETEIIEL